MPCAARGCVVLFLSLGIPAAASGRDLTFEQRVKAQEAVERVYYAHQIGSTRAFEEAVPRAVLEQGVETYLEQTAALQTLWKTPITDEMLERELRRMAAHTRSPERLRELFHALGDDPFLIQECLVRATLVDRLARTSFGFDESIHAEKREEAEELRRGLLRSGVERFADDPRRTVVELVRAGSGDDAGSTPHAADARTIGLSPEAFARWRGAAPARVGEIGAVRSERDAFVISVVLEERPGWARLANFTVTKRTWDDWWNRPESSLEPGAVHAVANPETSRSLAIPDAGDRSPAARSPFPVDSDDAWDDGSLDDLPYPRSNHVKVWTGSVTVVWGGYNGVVLNTGGRYDPATDSWTPMSTTNAPSAREHASAIWTGSVVVVRGGDDAGSTNTGGGYDPMTDTWSVLPRAPDLALVDADRPAAPGSSAGSEATAAPVGLGPPEQAVALLDASAVGVDASGNQEFPDISGTPTGFTFPTSTPVASEIFLGAQAADFGYCKAGPNAGLPCNLDADCPESVCESTIDNTFCLSYNMSCLGARTNRSEYAFNDVLETTYDHSPSPGRQTWIERNWNYKTVDGTFWRPFGFVLEVDANSTCVGGTNHGAYCTLLDTAGTCTGGGTCTGDAPTGGAFWQFTPNNRDGNTSLILRWPWTAINARAGTDVFYDSGFSSWMRSSSFNGGGTANGAKIVTYLDHANDRSGPLHNGLSSTIDFNTTSAAGKVGWVNAGYFDARISGSTPSRVIGSLAGVRSEVNLTSTGNPQKVAESYGVLVQFNPSGSNIAAMSHTGVLVKTPSPPGDGTRISTQNGLWVEDQQFVRSGGGGSAILVSAQTTSDASEGNLRMDGANWANGHIQLFQGHLWRDATRGVLRYKHGGPPGSEADGNALVTGTASNAHGVVFWGVSTAIDSNFDTGDEVCAASGTGLTCVETSDIGGNSSPPVPCSTAHTKSKWLAFCK